MVPPGTFQQLLPLRCFQEGRVLTPAALGHGPGRPTTEWPTNKEYMCQVPWVNTFLRARTGSPVRTASLFAAGWMAGVV